MGRVRVGFGLTLTLTLTIALGIMLLRPNLSEYRGLMRRLRTFDFATEGGTQGEP